MISAGEPGSVLRRCSRAIVLTGVRLSIGIAWLVIVAAEMLTGGLGIGFWPEKAWGGKPGHGVVLIPIRYPNCRRDLVVTVFEQAGNKPVVDEFVNYFCKYFEKDPSGMGDVTV